MKTVDGLGTIEHSHTPGGTPMRRIRHPVYGDYTEVNELQVRINKARERDSEKPILIADSIRQSDLF